VSSSRRLIWELRVGDNCFVVAADSRLNNVDVRVARLRHVDPVQYSRPARRSPNYLSNSALRRDLLARKTIEVAGQDNQSRRKPASDGGYVRRDEVQQSAGPIFRFRRMVESADERLASGRVDPNPHQLKRSRVIRVSPRRR